MEAQNIENVPFKKVEELEELASNSYHLNIPFLQLESTQMTLGL